MEDLDLPVTPGEVVPAQTQPLATQGDRGDRGDLVPCQQL